MSKPLKNKKGNISIMVAVFCIAFLAFCAFGIDMAYVTLNRMKLQRAVETTALATISEYKNSGKNECEKFFNLFKAKFDIMKNAKLEQVQFKNENESTKKVKISASLISPTFFLRFAGVGKINIKANSYAKAYEIVINDKKSGETIQLNELITNKNGYDIKIETTNLPEGYFIFAGIEKNDTLMWADIGCKADKLFAPTQVGLDSYNLITSDMTQYDLGKTCTSGINTNTLNYLKFYTNSQNENPTFKITILNNTKLITKNDF